MSVADTTAVARFVERVTASIETVIIGKQRQIEYLQVALLCRGHVLIEDVPGTGKTMLARAAAASMDLSFNRLQCTPDLLPNDVTGLSIFNQQTACFDYRPGPIIVNILLADEINRATPRTQAALLEAMQERQVTVDGITHPLPDPFIVLATQNPIEFEGTFPLPEAQLDRFLLRIAMGYPDERQERAMLHAQRHGHPIDSVVPVTDGRELATLCAVVAEIHVDDSLDRYILDIVRSTREHPEIAVGASPRGSLALYKAAQALAAIRRRDFVGPDDIKEMARLTLPHRLILAPDSQLRGRTPYALVEEILARVPIEEESDIRLQVSDGLTPEA
jgi:MoxR-like ATPase